MNVMTCASRLARHALLRVLRVVLLACLPLPLLTAGCSSNTAPNGGPIIDASALGKAAELKKADEYVIGSGDSLSARTATPIINWYDIFNHTYMSDYWK